jgi:TPR repeat protein
MDDIRRVYDRCHSLKEEGSGEAGKAADWLAKATEAGQPAAQAMTAMKLLQAQSMRGWVAAGGVVSPTEVESTERDPRALLRSAAATGDPEALWRIGEVQGLLGSGARTQEQLTIDQFAWWLVACEKGYDCSEQAPWHQTVCTYDRNCQPGESGVDYIQRSAQLMNVYDLDQRAREITQKLNSHEWGDLGLGS